MTAEELIAKLQGFDPKMEVKIQDSQCCLIVSDINKIKTEKFHTFGNADFAESCGVHNKTILVLS